MKTLPAYLRARLDHFANANRAPLNFTTEADSSSEFLEEVTFAGKKLGFLQGPKDYSPLRDQVQLLAKQIAPLIPLSESAMELDRQIEQLHESHPHFAWTGIYRLVEDSLVLTCFRGAPSPHEVIPQGNGICGAAVTENRTLIVDDVKADPRYLSCDLRTQSEIVVPIRNLQGKAIAEIDIDSHESAAFSTEDARLLEKKARAWMNLIEAVSG